MRGERCGYRIPKPPDAKGSPTPRCLLAADHKGDCMHAFHVTNQMRMEAVEAALDKQDEEWKRS